MSGSKSVKFVKFGALEKKMTVRCRMTHVTFEVFALSFAANISVEHNAIDFISVFLLALTESYLYIVEWPQPEIASNKNNKYY